MIETPSPLKSSFVQFSFIIPCYNIDIYINECLDSILEFFPEFSIEVLCIDDGSSDNTNKIITSYTERYNFIELYKNDGKGPGAARNLGLRLSKGEFVVFIDADDYLSPGLPKELRKILFRKFDSISFGYKTVSNGGEIIESYSKVHNLNLMNFLKGNVVPAVWGKFIKKSFLLNNKIEFRENVKVEDLDFVFKLAFFHPRDFIVNGAFYNWRQRPDSESKSFGGSYLQDYMKSLHEINHFCQSNSSFQLFILISFFNLIKKIEKTGSEPQRRDLEEYYKSFNVHRRSVLLLIMLKPEVYSNLYIRKWFSLCKNEGVLHFFYILRILFYPDVLFKKFIYRRLRSRRLVKD